MRWIRGFLVASGFTGVILDAAPARAWIDSIPLPAYAIGEPDLRPQFESWTTKVGNYPYPLLQKIETQSRPVTWRSINLENEYLMCRILPDLGGHLYSCRDKRNGREVFYANPVVKPGLVGLRGAWVAMGIESNFPIGHTRLNTSPVDFAFASDPDGSARAIVEDVDRASGMQFRVEFLLAPDSSVLEQRVLLYNRSFVRFPYYCWANASVAFDDPLMRIVLPTRVVRTHTTPPEIVAWPVKVDGKDGTLVSNHKNAAAWFAHGSNEPFIALYKPGSRSGLAHFADPRVVTGKKVWLWGSEQDKWVQKELTDKFPSYAEIQAGLFEHQEQFEFLDPEQSKSFSDVWIPIYDMGGVSRVTRDAVLYAQRSSGGAKLDLELAVTHSMENAVIRVSSKDGVLRESTASLTPAATYRLAIENAGTSPYTVDLLDAHHAILLHHVEDSLDAMAPEKAPLGKVKPPAWEGESESVYLNRGEYEERNHHSQLALQDYKEGLRKFPASSALKKAAGRLALALDRFDEAESLLRFAAGNAPADWESEYYLGLAQEMAGRDRDAFTTLSNIGPESQFFRAASWQLVKITARGNDFSGALGRLAPLIETTRGPIRSATAQVALLRKSGQKEAALKALAQWRALDPASSMLRFESTLLGEPDKELWKHLAVDAERVLDLVDEYLSMGLVADALALLERQYPPVDAAEIEPGAVPVILSPMIPYYRAWCRQKLGQDGIADLRAAASGYTRYLFPYRASSYAVLANASKRNPSDALAHLLFARLLMHSSLPEEAIAEYGRAAALNSSLPEVQAELIEAMKHVALPPPAAAPARISEAPGKPASRPSREAAPAPSTPALAGNASPLEVAQAALLKAGSGDAEGAAAMFSTSVFANEKQPEDVRLAYIEVQLQRILETSRAGHCEVALEQLFHLGNEDPAIGFTLYGFDRFMSASHFQYFAAEIESTCRDDNNARKRLTKISKRQEHLPSPEFVFPILAVARLNAQEGATRIASGLQTIRKALEQADDKSRPKLVFMEAALMAASKADTEAQVRYYQVIRSSTDVWIKYLASVLARLNPKTN